MIGISPWHWNSDELIDADDLIGGTGHALSGKGQWEPPHAHLLRASVDLRPIEACGMRGGTPRGFGFFVYRDDPGDRGLLRLGRNLEDRIDGPTRNAVSDRLGMSRDTIQSGTVLDLIWDLLGVYSDPDNVRAAPPIMVNNRRRLELHLAGHSLVRGRPFRGIVDSHWPMIQRRIQADYRDVRDASLAGRCCDEFGREDRRMHLRFLGGLYRKYGCHPEHLTDSGDWPDKPRTEITESFDTADSDTLGPDLTWIEVSGNDFEVASNQCRGKNGAGGFTRVHARAEHDLSTDDHTVSATVTWEHATSTSNGMASRFSSSAATMYAGLGNANTDEDELVKIVEGVRTSLATQAHTIGAESMAVSHGANGSTPSVTVGAAAELSTTDTTITGNVRTGLRGTRKATANQQGRWDNFSAEDLPTGSGMHARRTAVPPVFVE